MSKRFRWILVGLVVGLAMGGVAYAVVLTPPAASDRYYACVSNLGVVRAGTMRLNAAPATCPKPTDTLRSWSAQGPTGVTGANGTTGATGATGAGAGTRSIAWPTGINGPTGPDPVEYVGTYAFTVTTDGCDIVNPSISYVFDDLRVRLVNLDGLDLGLIQGDCGQSIQGGGLHVSSDQVTSGMSAALAAQFPGGRFQYSLGGDVNTYFSNDPAIAPNNDSSTYGGGWIRCGTTQCTVIETLTQNALNQQFPTTMSEPFVVRRVPARIPIPTTTTTP